MEEGANPGRHCIITPDDLTFRDDAPQARAQPSETLPLSAGRDAPQARAQIVGKLKGVRLAQHLLRHARRQRDGRLREARAAEYERKRAELLRDAELLEDARRGGWEHAARRLRLEADWFAQQVLP